MAAPSSIWWGGINGSGTRQGRIGVNISMSHSATSTTVYCDVWYGTRYRVHDSSNTFYCDWGTYANSSIGSRNIYTENNSGSGWSGDNEVYIVRWEKTYNRETYGTTQYFSARYTGIEYGGPSGSVTVSFNIPARDSYSISYNANGGNGAPGGQTKYYGYNIVLSNTKPTRTGYTFQGWGTSSGDTTVDYNPGATYTGNSNLTLYAIWKINTWTVKFDANGGTNAPASQTKTYGQTLKITTSKPTRTDYNFMGWGTSPDSTTVAYEAGGSYINDADITLYAIWEIAYIPPRVANLTADRCTSNGTLDDQGTYIKVAFSWQSDETISATSSYVQWLCGNINGSVERRYFTASEMSGTSGSVSVVVGDGLIDTEYVWSVTLHLADASGNNSFSAVVPTAIYIMDIRSGGKGIAFGEAAMEDGFDVNMEAKFKKEVSFIDMLNATDGEFTGSFATPWIITNPNGRPSFINHVALNNGYWLQAATAGNSAFTNILRMNSSNQVEFNWTSGGLKGRVFKSIWQGSCSKGGVITIPESPYYNSFLVQTVSTGEIGLIARADASLGEGFDHDISGVVISVAGGDIWVNAIRFNVKGTTWQLGDANARNLTTGATGNMVIGKIYGLL